MEFLDQVKMKLSILCLGLLLGVNYCFPTGILNASKPLKLAYVCEEVIETKNDQPPLVLLHGLLSFKEMWLPLMPLIARETGRKVCAADLRNHGDSPWSNETDTATMAADLYLLMESLNTEEIALLGHSLGGKVAVDFALKNPEKVERLIVEDMRPNGLSEEARNSILENQDFMTSALSVISEGTTEEDAKGELFNYVSLMLTFVNPDIEINRRLAEFVPIKCINGKCRWKANVDLLGTVLKDLDKYMPESTGMFDKPTLFIYGGKSSFKVYEVKDEILKLFPKTKFVDVERASHIINTFPEYKEAVINFLKE